MKTLISTLILAGSLVLGGCGEKTKEAQKSYNNLTNLEIYFKSEDKVFESLISLYKEDLLKLRECGNKLDKRFDLPEAYKINIEKIYKNELEIIENHIKWREENKKAYLDFLKSTQ